MFTIFKTIFSALVVLVILSAVSNSQTSLGVEGGLNLSSISVSTNAQTSNKTGLMVGGFADFQVSNIVAIRPGIRYVMKGFTNQVNGLTYNDKFSYIEIPALIKFTVPLNEVKPYFIAGPVLGIQLSATEDVSDGVNFASSDVGNSFETIDFGLYFGSGIEFHVASKTDMFVGGGYSLGLSNIIKSQNQNLSVKNNGIQFSAGARFHL